MIVGLPDGWQSSCLEEMASAVGGGTPPKSEPGFWVGGTIPWVSPKDMKADLISDSEDHVTEAALNRLSVIPAESVLVVVRSGILSRTLPVARTTVPVTVNQDMRAFVPRPGISSSFVAWQLIGRQREILDKCAKDGTTVASIEGPALAQFSLVVPPAGEQTRIVAKLEELLSDLDVGVAELKAAQKKLQQYRHSLLKAAVEGALTAPWREAQRKLGGPTETGAQLLQRILTERRARWEAKQLSKFKEQGKAPPKDWQKKYPEPVQPDTTDLPKLPDGWVWASVDQLSESVRNGLSKTPNTQGRGFPIFKINAVRPMAVNFSAIKHIEIEDGEAAGYWVEPGDVLATRYNGSVDLLGVFAMVRGVHEPTLHPDKLIRMKPLLSPILGAWMEVCGNVGSSRRHVVARVKTTAGQTGIAGDDLKKTPIPLAPEPELDAMLDLLKEQLEAINRLERPIELSLKQSNFQRQNILRAAFAGQFVPQDPNDDPASVLLERIRAERAAQGKAKATRRRNKITEE